MRSRPFPFLLAAVVFVLDRISKAVIKAHVASCDTITVIPGLFNIVHTENPGIAFGLLSDLRAPGATSS